MADVMLGGEIEQIGEHPLAGERPHRQRGDELLGPRRS